jgi:hypothetical protein
MRDSWLQRGARRDRRTSADQMRQLRVLRVPKDVCQTLQQWAASPATLEPLLRLIRAIVFANAVHRARMTEGRRAAGRARDPHYARTPEEPGALRPLREVVDRVVADLERLINWQFTPPIELHELNAKLKSTGRIVRLARLDEGLRRPVDRRPERPRPRDVVSEPTRPGPGVSHRAVRPHPRHRSNTATALRSDVGGRAARVVDRRGSRAGRSGRGEPSRVGAVKRREASRHRFYSTCARLGGHSLSSFAKESEMSRRWVVLALVATGMAAGCATSAEYPRTGHCDVPGFRSTAGLTIGRMTIVNTGRPCRIRHFSDVDAQIPASSLQILTEPQNGTLRIEPPNAIFYTPQRSFVGSDRFSYQASGSNRAGSSVSTSATIEVTVLAPRPQ